MPRDLIALQSQIIVSFIDNVSLRLSILIRSYEDANVPAWIITKHNKIPERGNDALKVEIISNGRPLRINVKQNIGAIYVFSASKAKASPNPFPINKLRVPTSCDISFAVWTSEYFVIQPVMNKNESKNPISEIKLPIIHTAKTKSWPHKRMQNL